MNQSGGTERQRRARERRQPSQMFLNAANQSLTAEYKLRPDSSFSQDDLDRFNRRQDEMRGNLARSYGEQYLEPVERYDRVEDIPRYTEEELRQQKIERLKANPRSAYNYKRPQTPEFGKGPQNQKVPQAVVDSYNSLLGKFRNLRDTGNQNSVSRADFDNVLNSLRDSPAEYIQPGEKYEGPAFENIDGSLQRDDPSSIFYQGGGSTRPSRSQPAAPSNKSQYNFVPEKISTPPMPNGRSDRGNYSRTPIARETATSTPTRRSFNPDLAAPRETATSTPTRRSFDSDRASRGTYNPAPRETATSTPTRRSFDSDRASRETTRPAPRETATSRPTRRSFNPDLAAPSEAAASTPTRRDNPRRRNRRQRELRVEANARANRRNRGPVDASTRSNRRAQRERAVIDRQRGGRGRRGGGLRGGGGRRGARARGAAQ